MGIRGGRSAYVGEQRVFGGSVPAGWLECDGAAVLRADYPALFLAIGETYGAGDGVTTFNLPDKRGRGSIGRGQGDGLTARTHGQRIGAESVALTVAQMPSHTHTQNAHSHDIPALGTSTGQSNGFAYEGGKTASAGANTVNATASNQNTGSGSAHSNMSPVEVDIWGIKF